MAESLAEAILDLVKAEIDGGRSSAVLAIGGVGHLNDMLHSAGIITDDAWNMTKGWIQTTATVEVFSATGATLTGLVEGEKPSKGKGTKKKLNETALAALKSLATKGLK